jgi:hypothetical protein
MQFYSPIYVLKDSSKYSAGSTEKKSILILRKLDGIFELLLNLKSKNKLISNVQNSMILSEITKNNISDDEIFNFVESRRRYPRTDVFLR